MPGCGIRVGATCPEPSGLAPAIRAFLEAENGYAEAVLAPLSGLRAKLVEEMKGADRAERVRGSVAGWALRLLEQIPPRRRASADRAGAAPAAGPRKWCSTGLRWQPESPTSRSETTFTARTTVTTPTLVDETGAENYTLRIRDIRTGRDLPEVIRRGIELRLGAGQPHAVLCGGTTTIIAPRFVYRHRLGSDPAKDRLVYEEKDLGFEVSVATTRSRRFVVIATASGDTSEARLIDAARPERKPVLVVPRRPGLRYSVTDWGDRLVILTNADGADDFKIVTAPASAPGRKNWRDLVPYREGRRIIDVTAFAGHLVRHEREDGLERLVVRRKADGGEHAVSFGEEAYSLELGSPYEFDTRTFRFSYSSPATPKQTFDYDLESRERVLRKQQTIPSGHDPSAYVVRRLAVTTSDNEQVPITVLHRRDLPLDGSAPLFMEAYGAYSRVFPTEFDSNILSLVDRGMVYAIAHVRGGIGEGRTLAQCRPARQQGEHVQRFHRGGRAPEQGRLRRPGTDRGARRFRRRPADGRDREQTARPVRRHRRPRSVRRRAQHHARREPAADGRRRPEWGDPLHDRNAYRTIAGYSPYENVAAQPYPHMLVTASMSDPRVQYWEPAKWVARIRALQTNDARVALVTNMSAGHYGAAGRFEELDEVALIQAFALDVTGSEPR